MGTELDDASRDILAFEREWWKRRERKDVAIRRRFGLSAARYHQLLNHLIERPEALAADPMVVRRLRRLREQRRRMRQARPLGA